MEPYYSLGTGIVDQIVYFCLITRFVNNILGISKFLEMRNVDKG